MRKSCDTKAYDSSSTANSTSAEVEYAPKRAACRSRGLPRPAAKATAKVYAAATRIAYTIPVPNSGSDCHMRVAEAYPEAESAAPAIALPRKATQSANGGNNYSALSLTVVPTGSP